MEKKRRANAAIKERKSGEKKKSDCMDKGGRKLTIKECGGRLVWCDENCELCLAARNTTSTEETAERHEGSEEET